MNQLTKNNPHLINHMHEYSKCMNDQTSAWSSEWVNEAINGWLNLQNSEKEVDEVGYMGELKFESHPMHGPFLIISDWEEAVM